MQDYPFYGEEKDYGVMPGILRHRGRRGSDSSHEGGGRFGQLRFDAYDDHDSLRHSARRMYRVLAQRSPRLATENNVHWLMHELEHDDAVVSQQELIERLANQTELEETIADSGRHSNVDEDDFVERVCTAIEDGDEEQTQKIRRKMSHGARLDSFIEYLLRKINQQWVSLVYALFPFHQVQTLVLICLVQFISVEHLVRVLPVLLAYATFFMMVYSTLKMFHNRSIVQQKKAWRRLVDMFNEPGREETPTSPSEEGEKEEEKEEEEEQRDEGVVEDEVDGEEARSDISATKSLFVTDSWEPYMNFALSLAVFMLCVGAAGSALPYCALLAGVSLLFSAATFVSLADSTDHYAVFALLANVVSCLPVMMYRLRFAAGSWLIWRPFVEFRLSYITLSLGIPSIALLSIPAIYTMMALRRKSVAEAASVIVPHVVCIAWFDVAMTLCIMGWARFGMLDVVLTGCALSLFFAPTTAAGAILAAAALFNIKQAVDWVSLAKALITLFVLVSPFLIGKIYAKLAKMYKIKVFPSDSRSRKWVVFGVYLGALLMTISFMYQGQVTFDPAGDVTNMTWAQYDKHCSPSASNSIQNQIECSQLKGTAISWKGTVQSVRVVNIDNSFETLLGYLPDSLSQTLRCFYDSNRTTEGYKTGMRPNECSLSEHNVYTFELEVAGPYGERLASSSKSSILLSASHVFFDILKYLDEGDVVRFVGFFDQYPVFRYPPRLKLLQLECDMCKNWQRKEMRKLAKKVTARQLSSSGLWHRIFDAFKFFFNFVFSPVARIK